MAAPLAALHAQCFPADEAWDQAAMSALLGMPGAFAVLCREGGMALVRVAADEAELLTIGVPPGSRRGGIGRELIGRAVAEAVRRGARALFLEVSVRNDAALGLYRRTGFAEVGMRRRYYPDGSDALILRRACA